MKTTPLRLFLFFAALTAPVSFADAVEPPPGWNCGPDGCTAAISETEYKGWNAWKLSDGKTEAIIVPEIGRVMSFRRIDGENWLWNAGGKSDKAPEAGGWKNWGGDKTWLAPQSQWGKLGGKNNWPPAKEWDSVPFEAQVLTGGKLKIWSPVSPQSGLRVSRVFYHDDATGDFVIEQSVHNVSGAPVEASLWNISQVGSSDVTAVYLPRAEISDYSNGVHWMIEKQPAEIHQVSPTLLQVPPRREGSYKFGTDAAVAAIAATRGEWAFVQKAPRPNGNYPDGAEGKAGTPVQLYEFADSKDSYLELELLSPLQSLAKGSQRTHTLRWSMQKLPSADPTDPEVHEAIEDLFG